MTQGARASAIIILTYIRKCNSLAHVIQIWWWIGYSVTPLWDNILLQNFAHTTTAQLSCHVQHFIAATSQNLGWEQNEISIKFVLRWKKRSWNGPLDINLWPQLLLHKGCFYEHGLTLILVWAGNTYVLKCGRKLLMHFTVELWEWIRNFTQHFIVHVITYPSPLWD